MIYLKIGEKLYVNYVLVLINLTYIFKFIFLISKYDIILPTLEYLLTAMTQLTLPTAICIYQFIPSTAVC